MIAVSDSVDVLRNGWKDAATMFVPESPEIAELLHARLEMAALADELDEAHLLGAIADIETLAASAGSSVGAALALRLRRTVYEYLLALDAAPPSPDPVAPAEDAGRPEVATRGRRASSSSKDVEPTVAAATADPSPNPSEADDAAVTATTPEAAVVDEPSWRADADRDADDAAAAHAAAEQPGGEPTWQYDALGAAPEIDENQLPLWTQPEDGAPAEGDTEVAADGFVAARAGFHIVEETHPNSVPGDGPIAPFQMPPFEADRTDPQPPAPPSHGWMRPTNQPGTPAAPAAPAGPPPAAPATVDPENVWHVRDAADGADAASATPDPLTSDPKFNEIRHRIEDRLRRKRCDEAAALLQELSQEPGGRGVAELAMNAGDRCQSLGKSNAALNCFLAASRADPVYEQPLSRLADICIDDQDGDLAVSYLERIARLCKYRGDEKGVLRVYRRIATIAPYREDILQALLNAQSTGHLD